MTKISDFIFKLWTLIKELFTGTEARTGLVVSPKLIAWNNKNNQWLGCFNIEQSRIVKLFDFFFSLIFKLKPDNLLKGVFAKNEWASVGEKKHF